MGRRGEGSNEGGLPIAGWRILRDGPTGRPSPARGGRSGDRDRAGAHTAVLRPGSHGRQHHGAQLWPLDGRAALRSRAALRRRQRRHQQQHASVRPDLRAPWTFGKRRGRGVPYVTEARPRTTASMLSRSQICFGEACFLRHTSTHPRSSSSTTQVDTGLEPLWRKARQVVRRRVVCPCRAWCQPGLMPGCPSGQPLESEVKAMLAWRIVMEPSYPTSEYASAFFRARGHEVSFAKPNQVKEFRKCLSPKVKTDDVDAYVIFGPPSAFAC